MNSIPKISITIPCRNEEKYIENCIQSLLDCDYPQDSFKVFISDGLSTDSTVNKIKSFVDKFPNRVELLINEKKTTPFALNLGLRKPGFDIKIILGAHSIVDKDYLKICAEELKNRSEVGCVGGIIENVSENETAEVVALAMGSSFGVGNAYFRTGGKTGYVDTVAFGAYRNEVFEKIGYFDEELARNQDDEFNYRLTSNGFKIWLNPKIKAKYFVRGDYQKLFKQYYQYGFWKVFVNQKHKAITSVRQLVPAFLVSYIILSLTIISWLPTTFQWLLSVGIDLYVLGALYFAYKTCSGNQKMEHFFKVFGTFFILHISYGLGYLNGIWKFLILKQKPQTRDESMSR